MSHLNEFLVGFRNPRRDFKLSGIPKVHFLRSEWEDLEPERTSGAYLAWRGFYAVFSIFSVCFSLGTTNSLRLWLTFVTRWCIVCQMIYSVLFFLNILVHRLRQNKRDGDGKEGEAVRLGKVRGSKQLVPEDVDIEPNPRTLPSQGNNLVESIVWAILGIVVIVPVFVTLGYWTVVFPNSDERRTPLALSAGVLLHGINALVALVDLFIIAIPVRVTHVVFPVVFAAFYGGFTLLYEFVVRDPLVNPKPYIYSVLNWREKPKSAVIAAVATLLLCIIFYGILWLLYVLRLFLVSRLSRRKDKDTVHHLHQYWLHGEENQK